MLISSFDSHSGSPSGPACVSSPCLCPSSICRSLSAPMSVKARPPELSNLTRPIPKSIALRSVEIRMVAPDSTLRNASNSAGLSGAFWLRTASSEKKTRRERRGQKFGCRKARRKFPLTWTGQRLLLLAGAFRGLAGAARSRRNRPAWVGIRAPVESISIRPMSASMFARIAEICSPMADATQRKDSSSLGPRSVWLDCHNILAREYCR